MMEKSFLERIQIFDENYPRIQEEIALAAEKAGRRPGTSPCWPPRKPSPSR